MADRSGQTPPRPTIPERFPLAGSVLSPAADSAFGQPAGGINVGNQSPSAAAAATGAIAPIDAGTDGRQNSWTRAVGWTAAALTSVSTYAAAAYALGLALMLIRVLVGLSIGRRAAPRVDRRERFGHARTGSQPCRPAGAAGGCRRSPGARRVSVPVVVGVLRPMILLPISLATGLTGRQLEYVLLHELADIHRYDPLANLLQRLIEALFFFHPAVWWLTRQVSIERENACDDAVLHAGCQGPAYAEALLRVAELCTRLPVARFRLPGCWPPPAKTRAN